MKIKILKADKTSKGLEYILLQTLENTNLKHFAITDTTFDDTGDKSNKQRHFFKFPAKDVLKGQQIALFTNDSGRIQGATDDSYMYFSWHLKHNVWNNQGDRATIIEIANYESKNV